MATIQSRNQKHRIVFRFGGRRFTRFLKTSNERAAFERCICDKQSFWGEIELSDAVCRLV